MKGIGEDYLADYKYYLNEDWVEFKQEIQMLWNKGIRSLVQLTKETGGCIEEVEEAIHQLHLI